MRGILLALLAGLLAVTAPPASALCADDGQGGCSALRHDLVVEVREECADVAALCFTTPDAVDALFVPSGGILNLTVVNLLEVPFDFEVFVTARFDDAVADDGSLARVRADRVVLLEDIRPGERRAHELQVDGNAAALRLQALADDGRQAELDADVTPIMAMTGGAPEPAPLDGAEAEDASARGAPAPGLVLALGALATGGVLRRRL